MIAGQKPLQSHPCWTPNCRRLAKDFAECVKAAIAYWLLAQVSWANKKGRLLKSQPFSVYLGG